MTQTIDDKLKEQGYRIIATLHRTELIDRAKYEIFGLSEMEYYIVPVDIALNEVSADNISKGLHYIYVKEG
ncbi:hypothetical protein HZC31_02605 [Candidatus Woesearchaeota archaeon]|nr:hypothetical protein [Candidatus Woesearchaeota archaeon]